MTFSKATSLFSRWSNSGKSSSFSCDLRAVSSATARKSLACEALDGIRIKNVFCLKVCESRILTTGVGSDVLRFLLGDLCDACIQFNSKSLDSLANSFLKFFLGQTTVVFLFASAVPYCPKVEAESDWETRAFQVVVVHDGTIKSRL